ncbi:hypothetical protein H4219_002051 [Mycoemilia scoparia]|uniref:Uncharacterized protein n=1 Tax=Mycoemilia scoparia TaxID=417184 RepID=A0A9W7ZZA8_9FUNG|nr:hypothetical protein H4219_002051 [Mycoemilia scoparia]
MPNRLLKAQSSLLGAYTKAGAHIEDFNTTERYNSMQKLAAIRTRLAQEGRSLPNHQLSSLESAVSSFSSKAGRLHIKATNDVQGVKDSFENLANVLSQIEQSL